MTTRLERIQVCAGHHYLLSKRPSSFGLCDDSIFDFFGHCERLPGKIREDSLGMSKEVAHEEQERDDIISLGDCLTALAEFCGARRVGDSRLPLLPTHF